MAEPTHAPGRVVATSKVDARQEQRPGPGSRNPIGAADRERDNVVRTVPCPVCGVSQGGCQTPGQGQGLQMSHTGRYDTAAQLGLVPPIVRPL